MALGNVLRETMAGFRGHAVMAELSVGRDHEALFAAQWDAGKTVGQMRLMGTLLRAYSDRYGMKGLAWLASELPQISLADMLLFICVDSAAKRGGAA